MSAQVEQDRDNSFEIDFSSAEFKANARAHLADWARRRPFYIFKNGPTQVIAGRYSDVHEIYSDPIRFSSELPQVKGFEQYDKFMGAKIVTQMDGEQHARIRRLLMPAFSMRRLEQLDTRIVEIIESMLDEIERNGREFDGMGDYAAKLVVGVLLTAMINLDAAQRQVLLDFQEVLPLITSMKPGQPRPSECEVAYQRAADVVTQVIADRRSNPRSDFLSDLVIARDENDQLTDRELFDQIFGIFGAIATTPRSAAGALFELYTHTDQLQQLIADPSLIPHAVEECLRIASNGYFSFPRFATCDTEVGGTFIEKGMVVRPSPQAANYDPEVFPDPLRFNIHRKPKRIMTFGAGPHHCIGHIIGRATIIKAISLLLARFPDARLADPKFKPEYGGVASELRMKTLPMLTH